MHYELSSTAVFDKWLTGLRNPGTKTKVLTRLARVENGNFGDHKQIAQSLYELRFTSGAGLRIYYTHRDGHVELLLVGGDKSRQPQDIEKAKALLEGLD